MQKALEDELAAVQDTKQLGACLSRLRQSRSLSLREAARKAAHGGPGLARDSLNQFELGTRLLGPVQLEGLLKVYEVSDPGETEPGSTVQIRR